MPHTHPSGVRRTLALLTGAALAVPAAVLGGPPAIAAPADELKLIAVKQSLLGTHYWYAQTYQGHPVLGAYYARHVDARTGQETVTDGRAKIAGFTAAKTSIAESSARATATARTKGQPFRSQLVVVPGSAATLAWDVTSATRRGSMRTLVDAGSGAVLKVESLVKDVDGKGRVFDPSPSVTLQNGDLVDADDADLAGFRPAYKNVTLRRLDGSGFLRGAFARNTSAPAVRSRTNTFNFNRSQPGFEQVMGYFHLTKAQQYIQSLGFRNVNNEAQKYRTTGLTADNSFYDPTIDQITMGTGGVDDAEDAEVFWHEYGHAVHDAQVPGFGTSLEAGSIGEGFGDYLAMTLSVPTNPDTATTPLPCIADWDAISYTEEKPHCLRRTDGNKIYPEDVEGEVHADGEIWSRALFDIFKALGRTNADTVIIEAQFSFAPDTSFAAAARVTVQIANQLLGAAAAAATQKAFADRGIL